MVIYGNLRLCRQRTPGRKKSSTGDISSVKFPPAEESWKRVRIVKWGEPEHLANCKQNVLLTFPHSGRVAKTHCTVLRSELGTCTGRITAASPTSQVEPYISIGVHLSQELYNTLPLSPSQSSSVWRTPEQTGLAGVNYYYASGNLCHILPSFKKCKEYHTHVGRLSTLFLFGCSVLA